ncbi:hypothetical protein CFP56_026765 [Quercus suber]|uniref:Uncharacterized protein n=1 Tax=Quercus suber TaxID=58331 RepID=A0AAW0JZL8_QUESU
MSTNAVSMCFNPLIQLKMRPNSPPKKQPQNPHQFLLAIKILKLPQINSNNNSTSPYFASLSVYLGWTSLIYPDGSGTGLVRFSFSTISWVQILLLPLCHSLE